MATLLRAGAPKPKILHTHAALSLGAYTSSFKNNPILEFHGSGMTKASRISQGRVDNR